MFSVIFCGKTYDEAGIEQLKLKNARKALKLLKSGQITDDFSRNMFAYDLYGNEAINEKHL